MGIRPCGGDFFALWSIHYIFESIGVKKRHVEKKMVHCI